MHRRRNPSRGPYFGQQEPEFGDGGGFGKHEDEPRYGSLAGKSAGAGRFDPAANEADGSLPDLPSRRRILPQ